MASLDKPKEAGEPASAKEIIICLSVELAQVREELAQARKQPSQAEEIITLRTKLMKARAALNGTRIELAEARGELADASRWLAIVTQRAESAEAKLNEVKMLGLGPIEAKELRRMLTAMKENRNFWFNRCQDTEAALAALVNEETAELLDGLAALAESTDIQVPALLRGPMLRIIAEARTLAAKIREALDDSQA